MPTPHRPTAAPAEALRWPDVANGDSGAHRSAHPGDRGGEARRLLPGGDDSADQRRILCDLDGLQDRLVALSPLLKEAYADFEQRPPGRSFRSFLLPGEHVRGAEFGSSLMGALRARVLVADDSDVFLRVAASVISDTSTLRLVGAVSSGQEAIRLLPQLRPDLVLLDFQMPGMDGIQTTRIIRGDEPRTVVIVISADLGGRSDAALAAGAVATLDK